MDELIEEVVHDANFEGAVKGCKVSIAGAARTHACTATASF